MERFSSPSNLYIEIKHNTIFNKDYSNDDVFRIKTDDVGERVRYNPKEKIIAPVEYVQNVGEHKSPFYVLFSSSAITTKNWQGYWVYGYSSNGHSVNGKQYSARLQRQTRELIKEIFSEILWEGTYKSLGVIALPAEESCLVDFKLSLSEDDDSGLFENQIQFKNLSKIVRKEIIYDIQLIELYKLIENKEITLVLLPDKIQKLYQDYESVKIRNNQISVNRGDKLSRYLTDSEIEEALTRYKGNKKYDNIHTIVEEFVKKKNITSLGDLDKRVSFTINDDYMLT